MLVHQSSSYNDTLTLPSHCEATVPVHPFTLQWQKPEQAGNVVMIDGVGMRFRYHK